MRTQTFLARSITILGSLIFFLAANSSQVYAASYYVSPSGSDINSGTLNSPFKSIQFASSKLSGGDTLYLRGGVYAERPTILTSGNSSSPITIQGYPNETATIDGTGLGGRPYGALVKISANYINFSNIEIRNSEGMGLYINGSYNTISGVHSHHHWENGILVTEGSIYTTVQYSEVNDNCQSNQNGLARTGGYWASGLTAARNPHYITLKHNQVYNNWGEGLSAYESDHITMEDNVVYNNYSTNVYVSDAQFVLVQRNLVYETPDSPVNSGSRVGIMMGDEKQTYGPSRNNTVINNIAYGNYRNFYWWRNNFAVDGLINTVIANNTFANSVGTDGVQINAGDHSNSIFENNIILQENNLPSGIMNAANGGITFGHNIWSKAPNANSDNSDIIGSPALLKNGSIGAGLLTGDWFKLSNGSPAINRGLPLAQINSDFFNNSRDADPDIGAIEYAATAAPLPTSAIQPTQQPTVPPITQIQATESWFEAEKGLISFPFINTNGVILQTTDNSNNPSLGGKAVYTVNIPQTGNYIVKGMVSAPADPNNSFYVNFDNELESGTSWIWDITPYTNGIETRTVSWRGNGTYNQDQFVPKIFPLTAGSHTLIIRGREPGVGLDKLMVSRVYKPGDANGDGIVDGIDYAIWLQNYGSTTASGNLQGDFNHDGRVDDSDYFLWLTNYTP